MNLCGTRKLGKLIKWLTVAIDIIKNCRLETPNNISSVSEQHWLHLKPNISLNDNTTSSLRHEFSPDFLEHFSIAVENRREKLMGGCPLANKSESTLTSHRMSRNKLHVLTATVMLLERSLSEITANNDQLDKPTNTKQIHASVYRQGQIDILDGTLKEMRGLLNLLFKESPANGVVRLKHILTDGPKALVKDLRNLVLVALGTRSEGKIRERGGDECVFALWLCGLWVLRDRTKNDDGSPFDERLNPWLQFLERHYNLVSPESLASIEASQVSDAVTDIDDIAVIAASYLEAVRLTVEKHPGSLYNSPAITKALLVWCLRIIREEGVRFPNPIEEKDKEDDEYLLYLEVFT